ncbi:hypothetical protein Neosp_004069 [[Neocosmospora] mangrovei]
MNIRQPDLCVGIDFGTTYTGVSWFTPKEYNNRTNIITQWPGKATNENKVPTTLAKEASGGQAKWGFLCEELAEDEQWKYFKLLLDPGVHCQQLTNHKNGTWVPDTIEQVHELVILYLHQVYTHLSNEIPKLINAVPTFTQQLREKNWGSLSIDFIFSTPTTWEAPVSQGYRDIVSKAGFGEHNAHRVMLGLTESEASAVFTCHMGTVGKVQKNNIILSIDAGGGTTDLAFVKATADTVDSLGLEEIHPVTGASTGSIRIDSEFGKLIEERVKQHPETQRELPKDFSLKVSQSHDFQTWKHQLGSKGRAPGDEYHIRGVTGKDSYSHEGLGIRKDCLFFTRRQLESCFDITLQEIKDLIKTALDYFEESNRIQGISRHVDHVILSGGLGSSDYVFEELTTYFNELTSETNSCVAGSKVFRAKGDARTVVMKGLLYDRRTQARALREHKARANYGVIVEEKLPKGSPSSKNTKRYREDGTIFATDRIRWLVKFGETIQVGRPITVDITKRLGKGGQRQWTEKIVWLDGEMLPLPKAIDAEGMLGMKELHSIDVKTHEDTEFTGGGRTWLGPTYDKCKFELMLVVGPSGDCDVEVSGNVIKRNE